MVCPAGCKKAVSCRPGAAGQTWESVQARPWLAYFPCAAHPFAADLLWCSSGQYMQVVGLSVRCRGSAYSADCLLVWLGQCSQPVSAVMKSSRIAVNSLHLYLKVVTGGMHAGQAGRVFIGHAEDGAAWVGRHPWPPARPRPLVLLRGGAAPRPLPPGDGVSSGVVSVHMCLQQVNWILEGQDAACFAVQEHWKGKCMALSSCRPRSLAPTSCMHGLGEAATTNPLRIPVPSQERIAAGGEEHDTIKPLAEHLGGDAQNAVLVDDEAWKAAPSERGRLLLVPSWDAAGEDCGAGDRARIPGVYTPCHPQTRIPCMPPSSLLSNL